MTTICLSEQIIAKLDNLDKPLEFCDESGHLIGSFIPEAVVRDHPLIARAKAELRVVETQLGPEMCVFGFEADLE